MLPSDAFADAVAFLRLFDLSALVVTDTLCSQLAKKASTRIRWEDFSGLHFDIARPWIVVAEREYEVGPRVDDALFHPQPVAHLTFPSVMDVKEFIVAAFPNCILGDLAFLGSVSFWARNVAAIRQVADSVVVKEYLRQPDGMTPADTLSLVRKFRKVKALQLYDDLSDDKANELADFYRVSGVQELHYYRAPDDSAPQILKFF